MFPISKVKYIFVKYNFEYQLYKSESGVKNSEQLSIKSPNANLHITYATLIFINNSENGIAEIRVVNSLVLGTQQVCLSLFYINV